MIKKFIITYEDEFITSSCGWYRGRYIEIFELNSKIFVIN